MYKVGDYVVYGMQGACRVTDIAEVDFADKGKLYYKLIPEADKKGEIFVSVDSGSKKMRDLMSEDKANEMLEKIHEVEGNWQIDDRNRETTYKQAINKGDYDQMMNILVGLYQKKQNRVKQGKRQTEVDDRIFRNTKKVLLGELAVVLGSTIDVLEKQMF